MSSIASTEDGKKGHEVNEKHGSNFTTTLEPVLEEVEVGYRLYKEAVDEGVTWTAEEEGAVRRKIDWAILPFFSITQGLAYLDKTALNFANLFGIKADLHITTAQFDDRSQQVICRDHGQSFHLGPGLGLMTPFWWRLDEQPVRHLTWYCFNGVASIFGDFLAYGLGHATGSQVPRWALIFLVLGAVTTCWGVFMFFKLPDSPVFAPFLSQRQKTIAIKRVAENRIGTKNKVFKYYQLVQAFADPKTYILFVASVAAQIPNGVVTNFSSIIISGMGFTVFQTTLLDIPSNIVQIVSLLLSGYFAGKFKNSRALMMACILFDLLSAGLTALTYAPHDQKWGRLVAFWFTSFQSVGFSLSLVMISANVGGFTKRQVTTVVTFVGYCVSLDARTLCSLLDAEYFRQVGNIAGPHVLLQSEAAIGYPTATKAMMAGYVVKTACHLYLGFYMWNSNRLRDRDAVASGENISDEERARRAEDEGMKDVTEFDNKWFRNLKMPHKGACLCGQTTIELKSTHTGQIVCHCVDCKQTSGSAFSTNILEPIKDVTITGPVKEYVATAASGNTVTRVFCGNCGSAHLAPHRRFWRQAGDPDGQLC
ncbi:major facilitator superfamily domain-containing protein [Mycena olivaceomarginata]|nr:major facilitator superfamily domain-containing protein [Mycena olivaceomarginata]